MAKPEHVAILKKGVKEWNRWREENPEIIPDLHFANLYGSVLNDANLVSTNLTGAGLVHAYLLGAKLSGAKLKSTDLRRANLTSADLRNTNLSNSDLSFAELTYTSLHGANLRGVDFSYTIFLRTSLNCVDFDVAILNETIFTDVDLSVAMNLDKCKHWGPSTIDFRTLQKSWPLPLEFLRGVGFPDNFIDNLPSLLAQDAIQYYTCFISYSRKDEEFADRLYANLQNRGIRCWQDKKDMPWGGKILDIIDTEIRHKEKVLLILSENSINSDWVELEVEKTLKEEERRGKDILIPFRLDDSFLDTDEIWTRKLKKKRHFGDFSGWKDHDQYKKAFEELLKWLRYKKEE